MTIRCGYWKTISDPLVVLDCLEATMLLKDTRKLAAANTLFARIIARRTAIPLAALQNTRIPLANYETLRKARVRVDCLAMLIWRRLFGVTFDSVGDDQVHIHLFADGSPQWRGLELFDATMDVFDGSQWVSLLYITVAAMGSLIAKLVFALSGCFIVGSCSQAHVRCSGSQLFLISPTLGFRFSYLSDRVMVPKSSESDCMRLGSTNLAPQPAYSWRL
mgnify:CR=1 FL=1